MEETEELMKHFELDKHQHLLKKMVVDALSKEDESYSNHLEITKIVAKVDADLFTHIHSSTKAVTVKKQRNRLIWLRTAMAGAAALLLIFTGTYLYNHNKDSVGNKDFSAVSTISPGKSGATLTLSNGKKILLSDAVNGKIAAEPGVNIIKSADGKLIYSNQKSLSLPGKTNTVSTANGETYRLRLPDGSSVWLNSASSLTFCTLLNDNGKRVVQLTGEAYFEIVKDKKHPFIVKTGKQNVEVLGTHFNINSYNDEPAIVTTLLEGSVKVKAGQFVYMLKPGEQALNTGKSIAVRKADVENIIDWKDGDFFLDGVAFKTAMRKISRWYDVEVVYDSSVSDNIRSGGWISRKNPLLTVLKSIESSGQVHFKIEGRKIYVTK